MRHKVLVTDDFIDNKATAQRKRVPMDEFQSYLFSVAQWYKM